GLIFGFISKYNWKWIKSKRNSRNDAYSNSYNISDLGTILSNSITNSISTILLIGGFIVLFSIIISILNSLNFIDFIAGVFYNIGIPLEY
ncbi:MAG: hypothetical protein IJ690_05385, partial [Clostridia bacterium]|nr:hypothetical protein [Clostridia bacterium]